MASKQALNGKSTTDATQLLPEGQNAYKDRRYEEAVAIFNKALASSTSQPAVRIQILDHLIGGYVKLNRLDIALTHGKAMIRCDRSDARGYLRCGQIQRLQDDHEGACKWYEQGLKNVKDGDKLGPTLAASLQKTRDYSARQRVQSRPSDPAGSLPLEIMCSILGYLDYKEYVRLLRVSKPWRKLVSSLSPITDTIDFSGTERTVTYSMVRAAVRRLKQYPTTISITRISEPATKYLNDRLKLWSTKPTIQHLGIDDPRIDLTSVRWQDFSLRSLVLGTGTTLEILDLEKILLNCHNLKILVARTPSFDPDFLMELDPAFSQPHLERLVLSTCVRFKTLSWFPNLVHLEYCRMDGHSDRQQLDLTSNNRLRYVEIVGARVFPKLTKEIDTLKNWTSGGFTVDLASSLRHLEIVCYPNFLGEYNRLLEAGAFDQVRTFAIEFNHDSGPFNQASLDFLFSHCSHFVHIRIKSALLGDSDFCRLVGQTPKLRSLIVEGAQITGAFLADLLRADSCRVESISLRSCSRVSSDTWDWMRQRGVLVDVRNSSEGRPTDGGRRLVDLL